MRSLRFATASICLSLFAACGGGGDSTTEPNTGNQNPGGTTGSAKMTATIDGKAWTAATTFALQSDAVASRYLLSGIEVATNTSIVLSIGDIPGPAPTRSALMA